MCLKAIHEYVLSKGRYEPSEFNSSDDDPYLIVHITVEERRHILAVMISEENGYIYLKLSLQIGSQDQRLDLSKLSDECRLCISEVLHEHNGATKPTTLYPDLDGNLGLKVEFGCPGSKGDVAALFENEILQIKMFIIDGLNELLQRILERCRETGRCLGEDFEGELRDIKRLELVSGD